ncbi:ABC transporter substrate-binding protein, partial [Aeromicrobium panaciterrae]|uniref:ABC transporter substrate-binding protein n=1 Tax=Aeromicrobium panaciterrae TaxID=363861 RepID=UPI0031E0F391
MLTVAFALASLLMAAACGGGSDDNNASSGGKNRATGAPIKIGLLNPVNGGASAPGATQGVNAGVEFVNADLGGVDGHPIEIISCDVDALSPETNINCANQLAKSGVVAVIDAYNPAAGATLPILQSAKIPIIGPLAFNPALGAEPDGRVYFGPPAAAFLLGAMESMKAQGYSSITLANLDDPSGHETIDKMLVPLGKQIGLTVKGVYFQATNPNFNVLASTIKSTDADVAGLLVTLNEAMCTNLFESLLKVGFKGVPFMASCSEFLERVGAKAVGAQTYSSIWLPQAKDSAPADVKKNLDIAQKYVDAQKGPSDWNAYAAFSTIVDFTRTVSAAKPAELTGPTVLTALKAVKGYQSFLGPVLDCGGATSPNCTTEIFNF